VAYDGPTADEERVAEADAVMRSALAWAKSEEVIRAVALVGSWSRDDARMDSDLDLIVLCTEAPGLLEQTGWHGQFGAVEAVSRRDFGPIQERRLRLLPGFEIEVGIGLAFWAAVPVDPGTAGVALDGLTPLYVCDGHLRRLLTALNRRGAARQSDRGVF